MGAIFLGKQIEAKTFSEYEYYNVPDEISYKDFVESEIKKFKKENPQLVRSHSKITFEPAKFKVTNYDEDDITYQLGRAEPCSLSDFRKSMFAGYYAKNPSTKEHDTLIVYLQNFRFNDGTRTKTLSDVHNAVYKFCTKNNIPSHYVTVFSSGDYIEAFVLGRNFKLKGKNIK